MEELARMTKNYSGAEIEGLVKSAASYAFTRGIDVKNLGKAPDPKNLVVQWKVLSMYYCAVPYNIVGGERWEGACRYQFDDLATRSRGGIAVVLIHLSKGFFLVGRERILVVCFFLLLL